MPMAICATRLERTSTPTSAVSRAAHMQLHRVAFDERQVLQGIAVPDRPNQICKPLNGPPPRSVLDIRRASTAGSRIS